MSSHQCDLIILGGGAIGREVACRFLTGHPQSKVRLFDASGVPAASQAAGAMISPWTEITTALRSDPHFELRTGLAERACKAWRELLTGAEVDGRPVISAQGMFLVRNAVSAASEDANFAAVAGTLADRGVRFEPVAPADIPGLAPGSHERAVEALHVPAEFTVDSRLLARWQRDRLAGWPGLELVATAGRPVVDGSRVTGVVAPDGVRYAAPQVAICAGVHSRWLVPDFVRDRIPPVFAGNGAAIVCQQPTPEIVAGIRTPNRSFSCGLHALPTSTDGVYLGATNNLLPAPLHAPTIGDIEFLATCASRQINAHLMRSGLREVRAGNRPISLDLQPLIGPTDIDGLWLATGTYREGLTLAPVIAELLVSAIDGDCSAIPDVYWPVRPPHVAWTAEAAVREAVRNHVAVAAEHETRLVAPGWTGFVPELLTEYLTARYAALPAGFVLAPDLASLLDSPPDGAWPAVDRYLKVWGFTAPS